MKNYELIIWDWNGTLLNDVEVCVKAMNIMLEKRGMTAIDQKQYKNIFTFPVQDYYKILGFDFAKESFEDLSVEYIDLYKEVSIDAPLQDGTYEALQYFKKRDCKQIIISASEQRALEKQVKERSMDSIFDAITGLDNIHARSKLNNAIDYIKNSKVDVNKTLFIGDTYHDYEVATAIACDCVLVGNGHQNMERFTFENPAIQIIENLIKISIKEYSKI